MRSTVVTPRVIRLSCCALLAAFTLAACPALGDGPKSTEGGAPKKAAPAALDPRAVEAHFIDGSIIKLTLRDDQIEVLTAAGKKTVRLAEVRKIEFTLRVPDDVAKKIAAAIARLDSDEFEQREQAGDELAATGLPAFPALLTAAKAGNAEVKARAASVLSRIKAAVPEGLLEVRDEDVIHTTAGKVVGKIEGAGWKATTPLFGEVQVKLSDVRLLRSLAHPETDEEKLVVQPDPGTLSNLRGQVGKVFAFRVTGAVTGTVWGSDVYTSDSSLAMAAVHAGVLEVGKTGTVKVLIVAPPAAFTGSTANGVTTHPYGTYPGAYQIVK